MATGAMLHLNLGAEPGSIIYTGLLCRFAQYKLRGMEAVTSLQKATKANPSVALSHENVEMKPELQQRPMAAGDAKTMGKL